MGRTFKEFLSNYETKFSKLAKECNFAWFNAMVSGEDKFYSRAEELQLEITKIHTNKKEFEELKAFKESGEIKDELWKRQLDVLYDSYLSSQADEKKLEKIIKIETEIEKKFSTYRVELGDKRLTDNEIDEILETSKDSEELKSVWVASKQVGEEVFQDVVELTKMRNEVARELGFKNYHDMSLRLSEQDPEEIDNLFDELDTLTRKTFAKEKEKMDKILAKRYGIKKKKLMPWHYHNKFFQEAPKIYETDVDKYVKGKDLVELTRNFYESIGLPIGDLIENSDLFEKEGKNQHAFCFDMDREGDSRVLCNVKDNSKWTDTMLHEYGHAVYDKFNDRELPWLLREPAHIFTTEAIAMMFARETFTEHWMRNALKVPEDEIKNVARDARKSMRLEKLVFSRWTQVMYRFEKSMYENPDQDLNELWWDLVEEYQMIKRPKGKDRADWASKIHVATAPAYYHNYQLGELLASQLHNHIANEILGKKSAVGASFADNKGVGEYLVKNVFKPGNRFHWNKMIKRATGEKLTARHFAEQFVD